MITIASKHVCWLCCLSTGTKVWILGEKMVVSQRKLTCRTYINESVGFICQKFTTELVSCFSNVRKKWKQVWPDVPFPMEACQQSDESRIKKKKKKGRLVEFIVEHARDVIDVVVEENQQQGTGLLQKVIQIVSKNGNVTQTKVAEIARKGK